MKNLNKKNVLIVSPSVHPYFLDGQAFVISRIAKSLLSEGNKVSIVTILPPEGKEKVRKYEGINYYYLSLDPKIRYHFELLQFTKEGYRNDRVNEEFRKILKRVKPDITNFHALEGMGSNLVKVAKEQKTKVVINVHDYWWISPEQFMMKLNGMPYKKSKIDYAEWGRAIGAWEEFIIEHNGKDIPGFISEKFNFLRRMLSLADKIIVPSKSIMKDYIANGFQSSKVTVIPNPVNLPWEHYKIRKGKLVFGMIGAYGGKGKGLPLLERAFSLVQTPDIRLEIFSHPRAINPGLKEFFSYFKYIGSPIFMMKKWYIWLRGLKNYIVRHIKPGRVSYWPKYEEKDKYKVMKRFDVLVVPSIWRESFSLVTASALTYGIPVIASNRGGMTDMVKDNFNGILFEQGSVKSLKEAIEKVASDRDLFEQLVRNAGKFSPVTDYEYLQKYSKVITNQK